MVAGFYMFVVGGGMALSKLMHIFAGLPVTWMLVCSFVLRRRDAGSGRFAVQGKSRFSTRAERNQS
nr:hypothetical protein [Candidatus Sigynarchaeum springense]